MKESNELQYCNWTFWDCLKQNNKWLVGRDCIKETNQCYFEAEL